MSSFIVSKSLNLSMSDKIASEVIKAATNDLKRGLTPVCVSVLDNRGNVIVQKVMDNCEGGAYLKFSEIKARTCVLLQNSSRGFREKYTSNYEDSAKNTQAKAMVSVTEGNLLPVAGGVLVREKESGLILGSIGVSGAAADEDEYLAWVAVKRTFDMLEGDFSNVVTVPEQHQCSTLKNE